VGGGAPNVDFPSLNRYGFSERFQDRCTESLNGKLRDEFLNKTGFERALNAI
jgi:hypothetical protein